MPARYQLLLNDLRKAFPQPVSDPVHDGYVVFSILRALDQVDALKGHSPLLGGPGEPDYAAALASRLPDEGENLEKVIPRLVDYLWGMLIWGHPQSQINVVPTPTIASIIGMLLPLLYNPNLCSDESGRKFSEAEVRVASIVASLVGYDPARASGVFTFGGTGALLYGLKIGLEKASPGYSLTGLREPHVLLCSRQSHYACYTAASWLGIGQDQVVAIASHLDNSIDVAALDSAARHALDSGQRIAGIVATMGSTDAMGIDDLEAVSRVSDRLAADYGLATRPHVHADAVIGWAWSVFNDYSWTENPLGFRGRTVRSLAAANHRMRRLHLADSIGIDFHKTGYVPYVSSLVLVKQADDFARIARSREKMPYLFQSGQHHPAMYTLETTRSATGPMAALANLLLLGKQGSQVLLGHAVEMAEALRELLEAHPQLTVLNGENVGSVTLFRAYPAGIDTFRVKLQERADEAYQPTLAVHNEFNRRIFQRVNREALSGDGVVLSLTDCYRTSEYGTPIVALKSYVLSPFADETQMHVIVGRVLSACHAIEHEMAESLSPPPA